jgi:hypothetical protein
VSNTRDGVNGMSEEEAAAADVRGSPATLITTPAPMSTARTTVTAIQRELATDFNVSAPDMTNSPVIDGCGTERHT